MGASPLRTGTRSAKAQKVGRFYPPADNFICLVLCYVSAEVNEERIQVFALAVVEFDLEAELAGLLIEVSLVEELAAIGSLLLGLSDCVGKADALRDFSVELIGGFALGLGDDAVQLDVVLNLFAALDDGDFPQVLACFGFDILVTAWFRPQ